MPLLLIVLVALALRGLCAVQRSLWLDEFHTLHHATAPSLGALLTGLRDDNHPPLSFLLVRGSRALFGDSELALRLPSLLCGLAVVWMTARLARRLKGTHAGVFAPLLVAVSSLQVVVSAEARMYTLTSLAVLGVISALVDQFDEAQTPRRTALRVAAWCAVGFHAHYFFLHFLFITGLGALILLARAGRARWGAPLAGVALGGLVAAPWYAWGFRHQFFGHVLQPGGRLDPWRSLPEAFVHLEFHNLSLAGERAVFVLLGAAALLVPLAARGALRARRAEHDSPERALLVLAVAAGIGVPVWSALVAWLMPRAGFNWVYLAASTAPFALVASAQASASRVSAGALGAVAVAAAALSLVNANESGRTEDYRAAVSWILSDRQPGDPVLAIEPGPWFFPPALGWTWYAPRLSGGRAPQAVPLTEDHRLNDPEPLDGHERVYLLQRGLGLRFPTLELLRGRFAIERELPFGYALRVHRFSSPRPADELRRTLPLAGGPTGG